VRASTPAPPTRTTRSRPANLAHTNLAHTNSNSGALLTAARIKPGDSTTGTVDITNSGDINGVFTLSKSNLTDTPSSPAFSSKLDLKIEDLGDPTASPAATPVVKYNGKLGSLGATALGTFTPNEKHRYKFTLTFPDGGAGADNAYKGASTSVQFDWESVSS
jgi:hypothetical protein